MSIAEPAIAEADMSHALYEFMPYGAPDLITGEPRRLFRATLSSSALWLLVLAAMFVVVLTRPKVVDIPNRVFLPYHELAAPPPLRQDVAPPPQIAIAAPSASAVVGTPVPTPDVEVPANQTIASQQEIAASTGSVVGGTGDQIVVVEAPPMEELPKLGQYIYADEMPVLVIDVEPEYPELARQAEVEGEIRLRVLVGKDGRVKEVHLDNSIPMLDDAAREAARKWVFKPALSSNRPVAVWISRYLRFRLTAATSP